jgi:adenine/guanine phosphoribosyltransferase-like PRPP-binding protein
MAGLLPLKEVKQYIRTLTKASPVCIFQKGDGGIYPYVKLPIETRNEDAALCGDAIAHMYKTFIQDEGIKVTSMLHPEAKAFPLIANVFEYSGIGGPIPRKRSYGTPNEVRISTEGTAYTESGGMCFDLLDQDTELLIIEGIISSGKTIRGFLESLDGKKIMEKRRNVVGALSVWERGNGLFELKNDYPGKIFKGFSRLEIIPRKERVRELKDNLGNDINPESFLEYLQGDMTGEEFFKRRQEFFKILNENYIPNVPRFFDEI